MPFPAAFDFYEIPPFRVNRSRAGVGAARSFLVETANADRLVDLLWGDGGFLPSSYPGYPYTVVDDTDAYYASEENTPGYIDSSNRLLPMNDASTQLLQADCLVRIDAEYIPLDISVYDGTQNTSNVRAGTYVTWDLDWSAEFKTVPDTSLYWDSSRQDGTNAGVAIPTAALPSTANQAFIVCYQDYIIQWNQVDGAALTAVRSLIDDREGAVNSADYVIPGYGVVAPAETLLFMGAQSSGSLGIANEGGAASVDVKRNLRYHFRLMRVKAFTDFPDGRVYDTGPGRASTDLVYPGWNHLYNPNRTLDFSDAVIPGDEFIPGWDRAISKSGQYRHVQRSFAELFAP